MDSDTDSSTVRQPPSQILLAKLTEPLKNKTTTPSHEDAKEVLDMIKEAISDSKQLERKMKMDTVTPKPPQDLSNTTMVPKAPHVRKKVNKDQGKMKTAVKKGLSTIANPHKILGKLSFGSENDNQLTNVHQKTLRTFNCMMCTKSFRHKSSLKQHCISIHEQSKYKCPICLKEFNRISSLNTHKSIHDEEKKFKCGHCGKAFHQKGNLKHHIFTHISIRPYVCKLCLKSFHQPSNLRTHMCVHDVMDPLPLAIILIEGEELAKMNLKINWNLGKETINVQKLSNYNRAMMTPTNLEAYQNYLPKSYAPPPQYDDDIVCITPPPSGNLPVGSPVAGIQNQPELQSREKCAASRDVKPLLKVKPLTSLQQPRADSCFSQSGKSKGIYPLLQRPETIKLTSASVKSEPPSSDSQLVSAGMKPTSSEYDAMSYCFPCNLAFTHKVKGLYDYERDSIQCPSCGHNLYTTVIPKCEFGLSVGAFIDEKFRKLQNLTNFGKENMHG